MNSRNQGNPLIPLLLVGGLIVAVAVVVWPMLNSGSPAPIPEPSAFSDGGVSGTALPEPVPAQTASTGDPQQESDLGLLMDQQSRVQEGIAHYHEAVRLFREQLAKTPDSPATLNNLAWLLATNPNEEIRNPKEAVALARRAVELSGRKKAIFLGTLAASYASAGDFMEASDTAAEAQKVAIDAGDNDIASKNGELLQMYQTGKAYHDPY